jgi:DNA-binding MarR family transcriptional regulator
MTEINIDIVVENLIHLQPLLYKNLLKPTRTKIPLPPGAIFVMWAIKRNGILSMSDIGRNLSMPKPHVTGLVDKLIAEELVERVNDPNDRRIVNVQMTEKGIQSLLEIKQDMSEDLRQKLSTLDEEKIQILSIATRQVKDILILLSNTECCKSQNEKSN